MRKGKNLLILLHLVVLITALPHLVSAQKTIFLSHNYIVKHQKAYNVESAEIYLVVNNDRIFLSKTSKYEFVCTEEVLAKVARLNEKDIYFTIVTPRFLLDISVSKYIWEQTNIFQWSFYKTPKNGSFYAVTVGNVSVVAPLKITSIKKQKKFYHYQGR